MNKRNNLVNKSRSLLVEVRVVGDKMETEGEGDDDMGRGMKVELWKKNCYCYD